MHSKEQIVYIRNKISETGVNLTEEEADLLLSYHDLLLEKNKVMNLTRITDFKEAVGKHYMDALSVLPYLNITDGMKLLDAGSGAGIPGIPLAIARPELAVTLMDSVGKKVRFHNEVTEALGLKNVRSVHMRFEDAAHDPSLREQFDIVTARAVAALPVLAEYCLPFARTGGIFVSYKSGNVSEEIRSAEHALKVLGGEIEKVEDISIEGNSRTLIFVRKKDATPKRYPRKAGVPSKKPL